MKSAANKLEFEELRSLDLRACATVGDIIDAMRFCAFGARMLGEVSHTILEMVTAKSKPTIVYSGLPDSPLGSLLKKFVEKGEAGISKEVHPFFGKLTTAEWDTLQWKHLDHHLRQFGA